VTWHGAGKESTPVSGARTRIPEKDAGAYGGNQTSDPNARVEHLPAFAPPPANQPEAEEDIIPAETA
jgi:hypothetical protein